MILERPEPFAGIIIRYDQGKELKKDIPLSGGPPVPSVPVVGMIGAGNFAQNMLLPRMKGLCTFAAIASARGNETVYVAKKYGFTYTYDSGDKVIENPDVNTVFVLTRHDTHAQFVVKALEAGKHVYVEKPLALYPSELEEIREKYNATNGRTHLMVGFNRRFSPAVKKLKNLIPGESPKAINIRINAGNLPPDHWVNDTETGGGRLIGEACHFIDLAMYIAGSPIVSVFALAMGDPHGLQSTVNINLGFRNGSIASISYFSNGSKKLPKENIEVFYGGTSVIIEDFKGMTVYGKGITKTTFKGQDKGHAQELKEFFDSICSGGPCPVPFEESYLSSLATFKVIDSLRENRAIEL
jgi:polar amino acid transport system substrate-binding protein